MTAIDDELKQPDDRSLAEELIDDRALKDAEQDLLHHKDIVDELEQLVCATEVPANVALYGAWGSGKSSLANILGARLKNRDVPIPFARFDAFKYADGPLRRLFISRVAAALGVTGDPDDPEDKKEQKQKYGSGLYTSVTKSTLSLPDATFWKLVGTFVLAVLCGLAAIAALLAIIVIASNWGWNADDYRKLIGRALVIGSIPAAMIAVLTALANRTLPVDQTRSAPSSEEEFERLFRELVKEVMDSSDADRIVIVIDELDRCSSDEVVQTLETVRTFLEVRPCVVVVAADQQVLEQALRKQARQETPSDRRNPYYSGGSAYLDKIFSYPLPLPQLRSRRLSDFSLDLIKPLGGLWKHIDRDWVLFALIPTHIRSPRRVKALLNAFVLAHRLAERRSADDFLPPDVHKRAAEIAKLTCLRIEFPLFAADLTIHPRLPEFVLALHLDSDAKLPPYVSQDLEDLARDYAERKLDVDDVLSRDEDPGPEPEDGEKGNPAADQANAGDGDAPQTADGRADSDDEDSSTHVRTPDAVRLAQGQHLLDYLQRTEQVGEIGSDLIFLEGRGTTFGIDAARADELVTAAVNGDWRAVSQAFGGAENEDETKALLRLLAREARDADLGPEASNVIRMLLRGIAATGAAAASIADDLIVEFWTHRRHFRLDGDDLPGALVLALNAPGREGSDDLLSDILEREEVLSDQELGLALIGAGQRAIDADSERLAVIVATWLDEVPADVAAVLLALPPDVEGRLLMDAEALTSQRLDARKARIAAGKDEEGNAQEDPAEVESMRLRDQGIASAVTAALDAGRPPMATFLAIQLLASETTEARELAADQLQRLAPITSEALILLVLNATAEQELASWPRWLGAIDAASLSGVHQDALAGLTRAAWTKAAEDEADG